MTNETDMGGTEMFLRPAVFLDRDGTINVDKGYLCRTEDFEYINGAVEGMKKLCEMGYLLIVITNQSGIARGYYTEADFLCLTEWMIRDLDSKGIVISKVYYCPHCEEGCVPMYSKTCSCRKPGTGLFWKAREDWGIDMAKSFAVGDRLRDLSICRESDVQGIILSNADGQDFGGKPVCCKDLADAAEYIEGCRQLREACADG